MSRIIAATDGSCLGNPGRGGWCWYVHPDLWESGHERHTTNNRMEVLALIRLLEATSPSTEILVQADSKYLIDAVTSWLPGWKRRGWRTAAGAPVKNTDLFTRLDTLLVGRTVSFQHVFGHTGHPLNEAADTLARRAAEQQRGGRGA